LLQRVVELLLAAVVGRLLDQRDPLVEVLLRHRDADLFALLPPFLLLHQERDGLVAQLRIGGRTYRRHGLLLRLVPREGEVHQVGEARLRDLGGADLGNGAGGDGAGAATATGDEHGNDRKSQGEKERASLHFHPVRSVSRERRGRRKMAQAARRASKIASTSSTASAIPFCARRVTSCLAET